jgi:hypothetical protein
MAFCYTFIPANGEDPSDVNSSGVGHHPRLLHEAVMNEFLIHGLVVDCVYSLRQKGQATENAKQTVPRPISLGLGGFSG